MSALSTKLRRDLLRMWPQLSAAGLVVACGVATLVMALSTISSLEAARDTYYERYRFPHVFTRLKRAPNALARRLAEIPGVSRVETRVVQEVNLDVEGLSEPAIGRIVSIADRPPYGLCELHLRRGRLPEPGRTSEVAISEAFAEANGLGPGSRVVAIINGVRERLEVVGVALSPEFIYQVRPGDLLPDERRFAILWMPERNIAPALDLEGAFNDVVMALSPSASERDVLLQLDRLTAPYGGQGAHGRDEQVSDEFVANELRELRTMSFVPPTIFLLAAAFILNIVFSRLVRTQREQIAVLKAFGYGRIRVGFHYLSMAIVVSLAGSALGVGVGTSLGYHVTELYARFFRFPSFAFTLDRTGLLIAVGVAAGASCAGTLLSAAQATRLAPAEAMRPEAPPDYRSTILERLGVTRMLAPSARMILRQLERQPLRALMSTFGISLALAVLVVGSFVHGSLNHLIDFLFFTTQRQDVTVAFHEPCNERAIRELKRLPGVLIAEPFRSVPVRIRAGPLEKLEGIVGTPANATLDRLVDESEVSVPMPPHGLVLGNILAEQLRLREGDTVRLEVLEGQRPIVDVPVAAIAQTYAGEVARMDMSVLNRMLREGDVASGAALRVDTTRIHDLYRELKGMPAVRSVSIKRAAIDSFERTIAENILRMRLFNVIFATVIAFGVIYNSARVGLAERAHELATLRILGFTRGEVSTVLLGELAVLVLMAIPVGLLLGRALAKVVVSALGGDIIRLPFNIEPGTYVFAVAVVVGAAIVSGLVVRRGIDRLDLVETLKTKG